MDERGTRDGRAIEEIGYYNPLTDPATAVIKAERAMHWLMVGAQPTDTVKSLFRKEGIMPSMKPAAAVAEAVVAAPAPVAEVVAEVAEVAPEAEVVAEAEAPVAEAEPTAE